MKKLCVIVAFVLLLTGCANNPTFETLGDVEHQSAVAPVMGKPQLSLPENAVQEVFGQEIDEVYQCDGYSVFLQTLPSGDMTATMRTLSGFAPEQLTVLETKSGSVRRYDWVWTAAAEEGEVLCRAAVLDDGAFHYCMTAVAAVEETGNLTQQWNTLFASFCKSQT